MSLIMSSMKLLLRTVRSATATLEIMALQKPRYVKSASGGPRSYLPSALRIVFCQPTRCQIDAGAEIVHPRRARRRSPRLEDPKPVAAAFKGQDRLIPPRSPSACLLESDELEVLQPGAPSFSYRPWAHLEGSGDRRPVCYRSLGLIRVGLPLPA